jgi:parvulin-like peptidyl-prolyl isomerase
MEEYHSMTSNLRSSNLRSSNLRSIGTVVVLLVTFIAPRAIHAQGRFVPGGAIPRGPAPGGISAPTQPSSQQPFANSSFGQQPIRQARTAPPRQGPPVNWNEFERARIMGRVGDDIILAGDILGMVDQQLAPYVGKAPEDQLAQQREILIRRQLASTVERKTLYQSFIRTIPPDRREEALGGVWEQITEKFNEEELPKALKQAKVETPQQLEEKLRQFGWSIRKQIRSYGERQLGMHGVFQKIDRTPEVTHAEMIEQYKANIEDYRVLAKVRFEKLSVKFDRFDSEQDAYAAIVKMGDEVVLGGAPFRAVAKRSSQGFNADEGGLHDWTEKGSLASTPIDEAVFSIPVARMSRILRDERGFHIVRVIERVDERFIPFSEAQSEIKKKIVGDKRQEAFETYIAAVKDDIPVWTIFDEENEARLGKKANGVR